MTAEKGEGKLPIKERLKNFSELYLAHHEISEECKNHVFKIGPFYLCVGCTSVIIGLLIEGIILFSFLDFFTTYPIVLALITSFGVFIALLQLLLKPKNKMIKTFMRFSLGLGMGALLAIMVMIPNWYWKIGLFTLLIFGTILYNKVKRNYPTDSCS
jgi:FtsH-binding integral membrane protein